MNSVTDEILMVACFIQPMVIPTTTVEDVATALSRYENLNEFIKAYSKMVLRYPDHTRIYLEESHLEVYIDNGNFLALMCNKHDENAMDFHYYGNGKIAIDNSNLFDKWSKCQDQYFFPTDETQWEALFKVFDYVGSREYYDMYMKDDDDMEYPENIFKAVEDLVDWSTYMEECIPKHLREKYKNVYTNDN